MLLQLSLLQPAFLLLKKSLLNMVFLYCWCSCYCKLPTVDNIPAIADISSFAGVPSVAYYLTYSGVLLLVSTTLTSMHVLADFCGSVVSAFSSVSEIDFSPAVVGALWLKALCCWRRPAVEGALALLLQALLVWHLFLLVQATLVSILFLSTVAAGTSAFACAVASAHAGKNLQNQPRPLSRLLDCLLLTSQQMY